MFPTDWPLYLLWWLGTESRKILHGVCRNYGSVWFKLHMMQDEIKELAYEEELKNAVKMLNEKLRVKYEVVCCSRSENKWEVKGLTVGTVKECSQYVQGFLLGLKLKGLNHGNVNYRS